MTQCRLSYSSPFYGWSNFSLRWYFPWVSAQLTLNQRKRAWSHMLPNTQSCYQLCCCSTTRVFLWLSRPNLQRTLGKATMRRWRWQAMWYHFSVGERKKWSREPYWKPGSCITCKYVCFIKLENEMIVSLWSTNRCTVGRTIACLVCMLIPAVPVSYRVTFMIPNLVFQNVMACRAFRSLKLGGTLNKSSSSSPSTHLLSIKFSRSTSKTNTDE